VPGLPPLVRILFWVIALSPRKVGPEADDEFAKELDGRAQHYCRIINAAWLNRPSGCGAWLEKFPVEGAWSGSRLGLWNCNRMRVSSGFTCPESQPSPFRSYRGLSANLQ